MKPNTEILFIVKTIIKLYTVMREQVCLEFALTKFEMDVLAFLANNPKKDTASDIIEFRMLPKSNVSQAVELLIQKGLLTRQTDKQDRRRVHLSLTDSAKPIVDAIQKMQSHFNETLFGGFSPQERLAYVQMNSHMANNAQEYLRRR